MGNLPAKFWRLTGCTKIAPRQPIFNLRCLAFRICMACYRRKSTVSPGKFVHKQPLKTAFLGWYKSPEEELEAKLLKPDQLLGHPDTSWHCVLPWSIACSLLWFENNCLRSWGCFDIYLFKDQIFIKIKSVLNKFWEKLIKVLKLKGDETKSRFEINHLIRSALKVSPEYEEINDNGGGDG